MAKKLVINSDEEARSALHSLWGLYPMGSARPTLSYLIIADFGGLTWKDLKNRFGEGYDEWKSLISALTKYRAEKLVKQIGEDLVSITLTVGADNTISLSPRVKFADEVLTLHKGDRISLALWGESRQSSVSSRDFSSLKDGETSADLRHYLRMADPGEYALEFTLYSHNSLWSMAASVEILVIVK